MSKTLSTSWGLYPLASILKSQFNNVSGELDNTQYLPIYKRLKIHILLLRLLRQGMTIDKAVEEVKERFKEWQKK